MVNDKEVVITSAVRTAIGTYGGELKAVAAVDLAAACVKQAVNRAGVNPESVGHTVFGNVVHSEPRDAYLARCATILGGLPESTPALTVNRLCGSGLQAIVSASQGILLGEYDCAVAGGAENMSRVPYYLPGLRWGQRMGDAQAIDGVSAALQDPFGNGHMGCTGENLAQKYGISREDQDALAVESHHRAARAWEQGRFAEQIIPVEIKSRKGIKIFDRDEHFRADASLEGMASLRAVFQKDGTVTAGNASGINDAAAALVLMESKAAEAQNIKPLARLVGYAYAGVDPRYMGIGPVPAVRSVMEKTGLSIAQMDTIELNEAFAAQALSVIRELDLPMHKTNPNGSGISLGHPIGATGAVITVKALHELQRIDGRYALITMCIGGGQGNAAIIERL
ncbi:MAG: acetyl-CoA C-acyltransferase family protein [Gammaproteobacteria bacterium]|nr:acetyl-CoA C-acyltransferase family protein [Gammaproteobacteria bacterium]